MAIHAATKKVLFGQTKPVLMVGMARDMLTRAQSYYALMNGSMMLITVYTVRETTIKTHLPWMNFGIFFGIVIGLLSLVMIMDYKLVYPSQIAFHQHEAWKHRSPVRKDFEAQRERLKEQAEDIKEIKKMLKELKDGR